MIYSLSICISLKQNGCFYAGIEPARFVFRTNCEPITVIELLDHSKTKQDSAFSAFCIANNFGMLNYPKLELGLRIELR